MTHLHSPNLTHPDPVLALARCREGVERDGWYGVSVLGDRPLTYTTGLTQTWGHLELAVTGLPASQGHMVLAAAVADIAAGARFAAGDEVLGILGGAPVRFGPVDPGRCRARFGLSDLFYGYPPERLQLVWPDLAGRFPGDPACDPAVAGAQLLVT